MIFNPHWQSINIILSLCLYQPNVLSDWLILAILSKQQQKQVCVVLINIFFLSSIFYVHYYLSFLGNVFVYFVHFPSFFFFFLVTHSYLLGKIYVSQTMQIFFSVCVCPFNFFCWYLP